MTKNKRPAVEPTKCKHGTWPGHPLVDGRFRELMEMYVEVLEDLATLLNEAEECAAMGAGAPEVSVSSNGNASHVEQRLNPQGYIADTEVKELRKLKRDWLKLFRELVYNAERDLGKRPHVQGPRDRFGRLRILSSIPMSDLRFH